MSLLLDIQQELTAASARVAALELALRANPGYPSIAANLESAVKVQSLLQLQFSEAAARLGVEVCRYRAFDDQEQSIAGPALGAIADFQTLLSVVYASLKYGRRTRAVIPADVAEDTALQFGFAFSGSIGVVLTVRTDTNLFGESYFDDSVDMIFAMAKARTPKDITAFAEKLGPGAINAMYRWVNDNASHGLGADIEWRRGDDIRGRLFIQRQDLSKLKTAIEETGGIEEKTITVIGTLVMADADTGRFKFKREGLPIIRGTVEPGAIDRTHEATVPRMYKARIRKTVRTRFAKGTQETRHHLLDLKVSKKAGNE
jgi:hypothetical protein